MAPKMYHNHICIDYLRASNRPADPRMSILNSMNEKSQFVLTSVTLNFTFEARVSWVSDLISVH